MTELNGKQVIEPNSFEYTEQAPQGIGELLMSPIKGFISAAQIIAFVFLVGGAFAIINATGAIYAGITKMLDISLRHPNYKKVIIPVVMVLFSLGGATFGMSEEVLVFLLITIPLSYALGYDNIVGAAIPFLGAAAGFAGAFMNPFTVGIAQGIAEVDVFTGWEYRLVVWAVMTTIVIAFVIYYANGIDTGKRKPFFAGKENFEKAADLRYELTLKRKFILFTLVLGLIILILGVTLYQWYINEISALFVALGLLSALIYRLSPTKVIDAFINGASEMVTAAIVIGLARGLLVIAEDGKIIHTILYFISSHAEQLSAVISVQIMFISQGFINFFIPSGSGQAALTMPIMAPLSDLLGISRQTAVLAFQLGDGINNMIIPTSGVTMGVLSISKIPYEKWFKFILPLMVIMYIASFILLAIPILLDGAVFGF